MICLTAIRIGIAGITPHDDANRINDAETIDVESKEPPCAFTSHFNSLLHIASFGGIDPQNCPDFAPQSKFHKLELM